MTKSFQEIAKEWLDKEYPEHTPAACSISPDFPAGAYDFASYLSEHYEVVEKRTDPYSVAYGEPCLKRLAPEPKERIERVRELGDAVVDIAQGATGPIVFTLSSLIRTVNRIVDRL